MAVPLTVAIILLGALVGVLAWLLVRSEREKSALQAQLMAQTRDTSEYVMKLAGEMMRNQPKYADKMLDSLSRGITGVTEGMTAAMQSLYGPVQHQEQAASADLHDLPTPWYAREGGLDFTDPTDGLLGGIHDPGAVGNGEAAGNLILEEGPQGFGLPEGAFD